MPVTKVSSKWASGNLEFRDASGNVITTFDGTNGLLDVEAEKLAIDGTAIGTTLASGTQAAVIADPTGGSAADDEARTAINAIIDALQAFGIVATE